MTGRWWSQSFAPEGSTSAEGIEKQLGRPSLDPLTVLIREAAQNTWDARDVHGAPEFGIELRLLGSTADAWRELLLPPPDPRAELPLEEHLTPDTEILVISDRGTVGLGGPLRAGERPVPGQRSDFVQFVRNIGEPNDVHLGGGTYGFGKGIFYRLSQACTLLIDTHSTADPAIEDPALRRRLIGSALGSSWFDAHDRRHTGRHWWGSVVDDVPDPLLGDAASATAQRLGLPGFADGRCGTDIVMIAPRTGTGPDNETPRSRSEAVEFLISSMLWNLWPKMTPDGRGKCMRFSATLDGRPVPVPVPEQIPDLAPFVRALRQAREGHGTPYTRTIPPRNAGRFAMEVDASPVEPACVVVAAARPVDPPMHYIARMRSAELVVDYLEGPSHPNPRLHYGGVFIASEAADAHFVAAEPPTHDAWIEVGLTGTDRGVVQGARRFVREKAEKALNPSVRGGDDADSSLGELSARLGGLLQPPMRDQPDSPHPAGEGGSGTVGGETGPSSVGGGSAAGEGNGARNGPRARRRSPGTPRLLGSPAMHISTEGPVVRARVLITASDNARAVTAEPTVFVGGGRERIAPVGAEPPRVLRWYPVGDGPDRRDTSVAGPVLRLPPGGDTEWWVEAALIPDTVIALTVRTFQGRHRAG